MLISFSPMRRDDTLTLSLSGDVLTINGDPFDFSGVTEGAVLPRDAVACEFLASDVTRTGGVIALTVILPLAGDAPEAARFPEPITATDGAITLPGA